ncbi:MAG: cytochrome ubiquinol oxidase subunit I [Propionibacteriaceae bacterium]|jgi:cytochrome d ubiquinol oxidase subunit I|nr:cytochrome ubiquinol oxidase subunit I [Propionibacteriaceae bacterium]
MSPDTIARWQFGITTVYHFLFVPLTIALSVLTAVLQSLWNKTGNDAYLRLTKFFGRLFLINFAMGVVTGIVQEFQFGMNWSEYSRFVGDIFGAPLALEALIAFFLESTFIGMWIFGWDRLSKKVHLVVIWLAAAGTFISSIFIIAANAWMQNPTGAVYNAANGRAELDSLLAVILNPVFLTQWPHTIAASFVTAGAFIAGVAAYLLIKKNKEGAKDADLEAYRKGVKLGAWVLIVAGVCTIVTGDLLGKQMVTHQPAKMAAAENIQDPQEAGQTGFQIIPGVEVFPGLVNWLYGSEKVPSIPEIRDNFTAKGYQIWDGTAFVDPDNALQTAFASELAAIKADIDPIPSVGANFWSFRLMIGIGCLAMLGGILLLAVTRGKKIPKPSALWTAVCVALPLLPLLANTFGWIFTEMGRQPYIVNGVMPTLQGLSPINVVPVASVWFSLIVYTLVYGILAVIEVGLLLKYIKMGLPDETAVSVKDEAEPLSFAY